MSRILFATLLVAILSVLATPVRAQSEIPTHVTLQNRTGELPFSSNIGTSIEHVDAATGTLNVRIPIMSAPGRGMGAGLSLQFNSNYFLLAPRTDSLGNPYFIWTIPVHGVWQTNHPYTSFGGSVIKCTAPATGSDSYSSSYMYYDGDGGQHPLAVQLHTNTGTCSGLTDGPNPDLTAAGVSGTSVSATTSDGTVFSTSSWKDSNGNQETWGYNAGSFPGTEANTVSDTLGRSFFTSSFTVDASGHPLTTTYTVHDSSGTTRNYVVNWQSLSYATAFNNSTGVYGAEHELTTQWYVISSIQLPNNTSYVFKYETGSYGEITEIDLPTGGVITYTYANVENNRRTRRAVATRTETVNGVSSTWTFSIVPTNSINADTDAYTSTVTYPPVGSPAVANQSVFTSGDGAITDAKIYAGSATGTPLREYKMVYAQDQDPYADDACYNASGNLPPIPVQPVGQRLTSITTILENGLQSQKQYDYETFSYVYHPNHCNFILAGSDSKVAKTYTTSRGNVTEIREYDWAQGAPGPLIRRTDNVYSLNANSNYLSRNIVDKITQQTVYDSSGNQIAQT